MNINLSRAKDDKGNLCFVLASSRNHTGNDAVDNVDNYVKEW